MDKIEYDEQNIIRLDESPEKEAHPRRRLSFEQDDETHVTHSGSESIQSIHAKISRNIIPEIGREFETEKGAYEFYNAYAKEVGFSIRIHKYHKEKGVLLDRTFVCSREGTRAEDKRATGTTNHRPETRCNCEAKLKISCRKSSKFKIVKFVASHNVATPSKSHLCRSQRKVSLAQGLEVEMIDESGIAPRLGFELISKQAGGPENVGYTRIEYKNHLRTKRNLAMKSGDASGILEYLQEKQLDDPNFFYAIQVDEDDMITNIFWADAKMMADFEEFGDVVCFDTTYRKHKDGRPIALFVGVNHHKQTCVFGAALLYDETAETFKWLFDTFAEAMDGKLPKTILTDQDAAMAKALASQWPQTYHRLCVWHIFQNAAIHLSHVFSSNKDFSKDFSSCVYDYEHESDFLDAWNNMLFKYDLQCNDWLERMFKIKKKWALVYGRDTFCADMTTTQRSESMNKLIKSYVNYKHDLRRFFSNFERLLRDRRYDEMKADFNALQSTVVLSLSVEILKHAVNIYTPAVFYKLQAELSKAYDSLIIDSSGTEELMQYTIKPLNKGYNYVVSYNSLEETILCTCRKFEFGGILCSHALKVLSTKGVTKIPNKYILKRWTINAKKKSMQTNVGIVSNEDPKAKIGRRYRDLCHLSKRLTTQAAETEETYGVVREGLIQLFEQVCLNSGSKSNQSTSRLSNVVTNVMDSAGVIKIVKGVKVKKKSGNSSKRPKSALETAQARARNKVRAKDKGTSSTNSKVSIASQHDQVPSSNILSQQSVGVMSSETTLQPVQVSQQMPSYQELLSMNYSTADYLMYPLFEPTLDSGTQTQEPLNMNRR